MDIFNRLNRKNFQDRQVDTLIELRKGIRVDGNVDPASMFTGTCAFGYRKECQNVIESLGGSNAKGITKNIDCLVLETYVTDSWIHESFGWKVERVVECRDAGFPI